MKVLIIEDGFEYSETLGQFLAEGFEWTRAGSGPRALELLPGEFEAIFLDMRFDRVAESELLGDIAEIADRFNGDPVQARSFLEDHQGNFILAAIRDAGLQTGVLLSYDFDGEPRRWERIAARYGPVDFLPDNASPTEIAERLRRLRGR